MDYRLNNGGGKTAEEKYHYTVGYVDGCYSSWSLTLPSGVVNIGGRLFLSIPNAWDDRLVYYPWYCGHIYWDSNQYETPGDNASSDNTHPLVTADGAQWNDVYYRYYHGNENNLIPEVKKNQFPYKLLVDYGEYKNTANILPAYIFNTTEVNLLLKLNISVYNAGQVKFLFSAVSNSVSVMIDFGDGTSDKLSVSTPIVHTYSSSGQFVVKLYLLNGYYDIDSPIVVRSTNDSNPITSSARDYPLVYELYNSSSVSAPTLTGIFMNPKHSRSCTELSTFVAHRAMESVQYIKDYIDSDITEYKYLRLKNSHIDNLYAYSTDEYFKIVLEDMSSINNIYVASNIVSLDLSAGDTTSILRNSGSNIYLYYNGESNILGKVVNGDFEFNSDCKSVSFGNNVTFHVRSSVLRAMQSKYPLLNFVSI